MIKIISTRTFAPTFIFCVGLIIFSSGCKKYLSTLPEDFAAPENFYNNESQLNQALTGVYSALNEVGTFSRNLPVELAHSSDEAFYKRSGVTVTPMIYNHDPAHPIIQAAWTALYKGINSANALLANANKPVMEEVKRKQIIAEAKALRAFYYFQLVHHWGDVPVYLTPTTDGKKVNNPRVNQREVYDLIVRDFKEALPDLPPNNSISGAGRLSVSAVQGLLARVHLKMAGEPLRINTAWAEAKFWAQQVIQSNLHQLHPDYIALFTGMSQEMYYPQESIWEIEFSGNGSLNPALIGSWFAKQFSIRNTSENLYGYATLGVTAALNRKYDDHLDVRKNRNIATFYYSPSTTNNLGDTLSHPATELFNRDGGKWRIYDDLLSPRNRNLGPTNFPVLRYADVLLMFAEAENEINGPTDSAFLALNLVRQRAGTYLTDRNLLPDQNQFRDFLMDERSRELCFEGLRKFDLIRWGIFLPVMKQMEQDFQTNAPSSLRYAAAYYRNVAPRHLYLPIPSLEMSLNKSMTQNPNW